MDWATRARQIAEQVQQEVSGLPPDFPDIFVRLIAAESGFDPSAVSPAGAVGIAQLMPVHWGSVDPNDPEASLQYAARYLASLMLLYGREMGVAAYNAGPGTVASASGPADLPSETKVYLSRVLGPQQEMLAVPQGVPAAAPSGGSTMDENQFFANIVAELRRRFGQNLSNDQIRNMLGYLQSQGIVASNPNVTLQDIARAMDNMAAFFRAVESPAPAPAPRPAPPPPVQPTGGGGITVTGGTQLAEEQRQALALAAQFANSQASAEAARYAADLSNQAAMADIALRRELGQGQLALSRDELEFRRQQLEKQIAVQLRDMALQKLQQAAQLEQGRYQMGQTLANQLIQVQQNPFSVVAALRAWGAGQSPDIVNQALTGKEPIGFPYGQYVNDLLGAVRDYILKGGTAERALSALDPYAPLQMPSWDTAAATNQTQPTQETSSTQPESTPQSDRTPWSINWQKAIQDRVQSILAGRNRGATRLPTNWRGMNLNLGFQFARGGGLKTTEPVVMTGLISGKPLAMVGLNETIKIEPGSLVNQVRNAILEAILGARPGPKRAPLGGI